MQSSPDHVRQPALPLGMAQDVLHVMDLQAPPARSACPTHCLVCQTSVGMRSTACGICGAGSYVAAQCSGSGAMCKEPHLCSKQSAMTRGSS